VLFRSSFDCEDVSFDHCDGGKVLFRIPKKRARRSREYTVFDLQKKSVKAEGLDTFLCFRI
jgi:hypothetical protein